MQRRIFTWTAVACAALSLPVAVMAQSDYPQRAVKVVVGFQAGGPTDVVARLVAKSLQDQLKKPFVVENKPGATSNIAAEMVALAPADGYTLLFAASPLAMNRFTHPQQKYDPLTSFEPIAKVSSAPGVLAVSPKLAAKTYAEFEALAKQAPNKLSYGTTGAGGTQHMATRRLEQLAGIQMLHVPYSGGPGVLNDLMAGNIDAAIMTATGSMPHLEAGKVRPLAVTGSTRIPSLPNVPTFIELGQPDMRSDSWNALLAPAGTPQPIIDKLAAAIGEAVKSPQFAAVLTAQGASMLGNTPAQFKSELKAEVAYWTEQFKNVKIEK